MQKDNHTNNSTNSSSLCTVNGLVTYQYNKFVGTRGDNGATVMLIPANNEVKNYDNHSAAMLLSGTYDSGIMITKCDGYGNFSFGQTVPMGDYHVFIISKNTTSSSRFADEEQWEDDIEDAFGDYFSDDDLDTLKTFIGYKKLSRDYTNFGDYKYQEISFSVDFGYTYIR